MEDIRRAPAVGRLDLIDRQLLQALCVDGRAPLSRIAQALEVTARTATQHYRRLREAGGLRVLARADGLRGGDRRGDRFGVGDRRRFRDHDRLRFGIGVAYAGYPYGYDDGAGYYDDGDAYSYPDDQGYYQPFDYDDGDAQGYVGYGGGAYDAGGYGDDQADQQVYDQSGYDQNGYDQGGYDEGAAPAYGDDGGARGWSAGAPPADCGSWVWRDRAQRYQWVAAPCPCPPGQQGW